MGAIAVCTRGLEGTVLSTIPTISTTIPGLLVGKLLIGAGSTKSKLKVIGGTGVLLPALGYGIAPFVPVVMKMWTISYGLMSAGWTCLMFLAFFWIIDVHGYRRWAFPFIVIGMNSIFIYMLTSLIPLNQMVDVFTKGIVLELGQFGALSRQSQC